MLFSLPACFAGRRPGAWWPLFGLLLLLLGTRAQADTGIFEGYVFLNLNNGGRNTYDLNPSTQTTAFDFVGPSLGTLAVGQPLVLAGGQLKTFKNGGCNVLNAHLYYRVYLTSGGTPGGFTQVNLPFDTNLGGNGDQQWSRFDNTTDVAAGLAPGTYTLEVYGDSDYDQCGSGTRFYSNNNANYRGSFTMTTPLPVELAAFAALREGPDAALSWATAAETGNQGFAVQVSADGQAFRTLGFVAGAGSSTAVRRYAYRDREAGKAGPRYYRLRQQDVSGGASFSPVRTVFFDDAPAPAARLSAAPNPCGSETPTLTLTARHANPDALLTVTDATGRPVLRQRLPVAAGTSRLPLPALAHLPGGLYLLHLALDGQAQCLKLLKQ